MRRLILLSLLPALLGQAPTAKGGGPVEDASQKKRERLLEIYRSEASAYTIFRDQSHRETVELQRDPVYVWTNPLRSGGQDGAVFVWTCQGRAEVIGTIFSDPATGPRKLNHEFHSLSLSVLDVNLEGEQPWTPEAAGLDMKPIADAPSPASKAPSRLIQMRALCRDFSANTVDHNQTRWDLRILPQPLYRETSMDPDVLDGALFAFVTSAGTDPEALLLIEARRPSAGGSPVWHFGLGRFTDLNLWVRLKGKEVFVAPKVQWNSPRQDPKHRYRGFHVREIPAVEDEAPKPVE